MKQGLIWRIGLTLCILVAAVFYLLPTFFVPPPVPGGETPEPPRFLPDARVNLGLDLMGGIHLTLEVEADKALETALVQLGRDLMTQAAPQGIVMTRPVSIPGERLEFTLASPDKEGALKELLSKSFDALEVVSTAPAAEGRTKYIVGFTPAARKQGIDMAVDQALATIRNRIDQFGVAEPDVRRQQGSNRISIQLPGMSDPERAVDIIGKTAHLEFRIVRDDVPPTSRVVPRGVQILPMESKAPDGNIVHETIAVGEPVLTGANISNASPNFDNNGQSVVSLSFDRDGARKFADITGENVGKRLAIVLDGKVHSAPRINEKISGGQASITGSFTPASANDLAVVLRAGSLPAPVKVMEQRTVGPSLGQESIDMGVRAALIGGIAVVLFMALYYGVSGLIADLMLILDIGLILAGMAAFGATLTLPGIAGIVLTIGMAVDANVLIFERIREELRRGLSPLAAVEAGFSRAMLAITDSNLTTIIAALILYQFGTGPIRGFAVTLTIGIVASMFTAIFVSRIIFDIWMGKPGRKLRIGMQIIRANVNINFVGLRKIAYGLSLLFILAGVVSLVAKGGPSYGIDFAGGATVQIKFAQPISDEDLKKSLADADLPGLVIQQFDPDGTSYLLRISTVEETSTGITKTVTDALDTRLQGAAYEIQRLEMVGPKVGADLRAQAMEAMYFAILLIAIYVSGRFEHRWFTAGLIACVLGGAMFGLGYLGVDKVFLVFAAVVLTVLICWKFKLVFALGAIVSILHDVLITVGLFSIMNKEFDLTIIAALLTLVGYSLNDTIIVYDRIRENLQNDVVSPFRDIINNSINQTLSRTILTSGTTLFVIIALMLFGGGIIFDFALVMCIGVIVGTLSSIFVASPVLLLFKDSINRESFRPKEDKRARDVDGRLAAQV